MTFYPMTPCPILKLKEQHLLPKFWKDKALQAAEQKKAEQTATTTKKAKKGWKKREKELNIESRLHMHARFINNKVQ